MKGGFTILYIEVVTGYYYIFILHVHSMVLAYACVGQNI